MLTSLALIFLVGLGLGRLMTALRLPALLGMLLTGILLGPHMLNLLSGNLLGISADLQQLALIIILTRAGLALDVRELRRAGWQVVLMCFVPACFEIIGMVLLAPRLLGISVLEAAIMGAVTAAVSPAVIVPKMLRLIEEGYGREKSIPQLIMAGASVDDVFVIVLFAAFTGLAQGGTVSAGTFLQIPVSIVTGLAVGIGVGLLFGAVYRRVHVRDSVKVVVLLSLAFLLVALEGALKGTVPFSGLLAVMSCGIALRHSRPEVAGRLSAKYAKLWVAAEVLLFVLVGAAVDVRFALSAGLAAILVIFGGLVFRMAGVLFCMVKSPLSPRERLFCMLAYCPKATVQAAIGGVPLAMGLGCGQIVLTVAVLAILITAPLGTLGIELTYRKWLNRNA